MSNDMIDLGNIEIPVLQYASQGNAVLGIRDSGKSYTATYIAERLLDAGVPFVAFDPIGIWRYLRVEGNGKGYPVVVVGGEDGDILLSPEIVQDVIRAAMADGVSLVIDLYDMALSKADWKRIVEQSVRLLLYENGSHGLRHIFIEEAAEFCPQRVGPDQGRVYAEIEKLARMGGNAKLGYTLINQRAEEVNKAVLELCDCLFLHRQKGRHSLTALSKWLDVGNVQAFKQIVQTLPSLPQGQCWVWGNGNDAPVLTSIPAKNSFHPDRRGVGPNSLQRWAYPDTDDFVRRFNAGLVAPEIVETLSPAQVQEVLCIPEEIKIIDKKIESLMSLIIKHDALLAQGLSGLVDAVNLINVQGGNLSDQIDASLTEILDDVRRWKNDGKNYVQPKPLVKKREPSLNSTDLSQKLPKAERAILTVLAQHQSEKSLKQVALLAGYAPKGGGFNNAVSALRKAGYISGGRDALCIEPSGLAALGSFQKLPEGQALIDYWLNGLPKAQRALFSVAVDVFPNWIEKEALIEEAGYAVGGGGVENAISRLKTLELLVRDTDRSLRANPVLLDWKFNRR